MGEDQNLKTDILIIGASQSGSCLARQLKLTFPDLSILNIERKTEFDRWVGESTVEAWEDYMTRVLGLGPFIEKNFITKHGLRMFFDSEEKNLSLSEMSEFGRSSYHSIPARNLDRKVFDEYMIQSNKELGVDVRLGVKVLSGGDKIIIDGENGHSVETSIGTIQCKYLIDAAGRMSPLAKTLNLVDREERNNSFSYWSRIKGCNWIDSMGDDDWRSRVNYTSRYNSTNHFMYRGYWMWLIPVTDDTVSIGIEGSVDSTNFKIRNQGQFEEFLRSHKCIDELLGENSEILDFQSMHKLPRCSKQFFSAKDKWFLTGMSGIFVDVMGSGTSRIYSENNRLIEEMIRSDIKKDSKLLESQEKHFNLYMKTLYEVHFRNLSNYDLYGSFDVWPNFFGAGLSGYFNKQLPNCITDLKVLKDIANDHKDGCSCSLEMSIEENLKAGLSTQLVSLSNEFVSFLDERDLYFANNKGQYHDPHFWEERESIASKTYKKRDLDVEKEVDRETYRAFCINVISRMCAIDGIEFDKDVFSRSFKTCWNEKQTLSEMFEAQKNQHKNDSAYVSKNVA